MVVEAFLIVSMTPLDLAVMPRSSGTNELVLDLVVSTEHVQGMYTLGFGEMSKFHTVVGLNNLGRIAKEDNCTFYKVDGRIAAILLVGIEKAFS